jgi:hypothetical protein
VLAIVTGIVHVPAVGGVPEIIPSFAIESQEGAPLRAKVSGSFAVKRILFLTLRGNPAAQFLFRFSVKTGGFKSTQIVRVNSGPSPAPGAEEALLLALNPTVVIPFRIALVFLEITPDVRFSSRPVGRFPLDSLNPVAGTTVEVKVVVRMYGSKFAFLKIV